MARLLHIAPFPFPAPFGSQVYAAGLAGAQARAGHEVWLACYAAGQGDAPAGVSLIRSRFGALERGPARGKLLADLSLVRRVRRLGLSFDAVLGHNVEGPVLGALCRVGPVYYLQHTRMAEELPDWLGRPRLGRALGQVLDVAAARSARLTVSLSDRGDGVVVPPGIDPDELCGADGARFRANFDVPDGPFIVYTGNLDAYQDLPDLLRAAAHSDLPLVVVTGDDPNALQQVAASLGVRRLCVVRSEAFHVHRDAIAAATVAALPRRHAAGFPMKLLNQLGLGTPTVGTTGACPDLPGCVRVPPNQPDALGRSLRALLEEPHRARSLGEAGRKAVLADWTWGARARALDRLLARGTSAPGRRR